MAVADCPVPRACRGCKLGRGPVTTAGFAGFAFPCSSPWLRDEMEGEELGIGRKLSGHSSPRNAAAAFFT